MATRVPGGYNPAAVAITGGTIKLDDGLVGTPSYSFTNSPTTGFWSPSSNVVEASNGGVASWVFGSGSIQLKAAYVLSWSSTTDPLGVQDAALSRASANSIRFSGGSSATTTSRTELNKAVAAISNAVATDVLTVTIPNAAHSASILVRVTGSLGAGGAIGANEATATNSYILSITRTAGVATVTTVSAAFGAAACAVAGAATVTCTAAATAMTGLVSAQQTFTVQATVSRSAGSSDNHTCLVYAQLMNANVTGITIA